MYVGRSAMYPDFEGVALRRIVPWGLEVHPPWSPEQGAPGCLLCGLNAPPCGSWAVTAVGVLVGGASSPPPRAGATLKGLWSWLRQPTVCNGVGAILEGTSRVDVTESQRNIGVGQTVLAKWM